MDGHGVWQFAHIKRPSKITKYAWQKKECYFYLHEELKMPVKGMIEVIVGDQIIAQGGTIAKILIGRGF